MSQSKRQSELFAGNDWTAIYKAFSEVNLNAFDFDTIRSSMVTYIRQNYPEQYNDWVVQSEFVAILDLVAYLGQSLAFRMDLNARENFIDLARKRENVLRLARFLSYNPRRNIPASGMLKITAVKTTESLYDSDGKSINNTKVTWNDTSNDNWFDQFTTIMNAGFISTNPFGTYLDQSSVDNVISQIYRLDSIPNFGQYSFNSTVSNNTMDFEVTSVYLDDVTGYSEVEPNPLNKFQIAYLNDGNGYSSDNTGFFSLFKQGTLTYLDYSIPDPIANNTITIDTSNINDTDVWVQTVNDSGYITTNGLWSKVGYVPNSDMLKVIVTGDNITYNSTLSTTQRIYQILTEANDQIMIKFGDGNYGQIPTGNIRVIYRVSNGLSYYIRPDEIQNIPVSINYYDRSGKVQTITLYYSLTDTIINASPSQTNDDIRNLASDVYATQGRMVSGSDYNTLPSSIGSGIKVKATNRYYSGQSRYLDLNDPTGQYQDTVTFADDGALYLEEGIIFNTSTSNILTFEEIITQYLYDIISSNSIYNFITNEWLTGSYNFSYSTPKYTWKRSTQKNYSSTGLFVDSDANIVPVGNTISTDTPEKYIGVGSMLKFSNNGIITWASVDSISGNGTQYYTNSGEGPIKLDKNIPTGSLLLEVIPSYIRTLSSTDLSMIENVISKGLSFGIGYDFNTTDYYIVDNGNINYDGKYDFTTKGSSSDSSWVIKFEYTPLGWRIYSRSIEYIFESNNSVKFFFIDNTKVINPYNGNTETDQISVLKYNSSSLTSNINFYIDSNYTYGDGYIEPRRVKLKYLTTNSDGMASNLSSFNDVLSTSNQKYVFHKKYTDQYGYQTYKITDDVAVYPETGNVVYTPGVDISSGTFTTTDSSTYDIKSYVANYGISGISFKWKHVSTLNNRIDPAISNIIDIFVLTSGYYNEMLTWSNNNYDVNYFPEQPTEVDIQTEFDDITTYKMLSDEIIWRPAKFKLIGGSTADKEVQFKIVAIPLQGTRYSSGEIKANIISTIKTYFDVYSWDFGETFYASELIGYIHQQLLNSISSIVIVPNGADQSFGNLFQITANSDELFFPTLTVDDVEIVSSLTDTVLRIS